MNLATAVDHLRTLADGSRPLAAGAIRDARLRTAPKVVLDRCDSDFDYKTARDELELAAAELHDLLDRAADVLDAYPGPFEPDGSWDVDTLARRVREALVLPASVHGRRLLAELEAARAWACAVRSMAAACDHDDPDAAKQWGQTRESPTGRGSRSPGPPATGPGHDYGTPTTCPAGVGVAAGRCVGVLSITANGIALMSPVPLMLASLAWRRVCPDRSRLRDQPRVLGQIEILSPRGATRNGLIGRGIQTQRRRRREGWLTPRNVARASILGMGST